MWSELWPLERLRGVALWPLNLGRDFRQRAGRVALWLWAALVGIGTFGPQAIATFKADGRGGVGRWLLQRSWRTLIWLPGLLLLMMDLIGLAEVVQFLWRMLTNNRRLNEAEVQAAEAVMGAGGIRYGDVRVASGGFLHLVFALNKKRPFVIFHTINMVKGRQDIATMVHELVHVYQYEHAGSVYITQALYAQATLGLDAYRYGGAQGLERAHQEGEHFADFNREQQARIAEDYWRKCLHPQVVATVHCAAYEPFIEHLRAGGL